MNGAIKYSLICKPVNITAKNIVIQKATIPSSYLFDKIEKCAQVIEIPDNNKITVFNKGTPKGFNGCTLTGGHTAPKKIEGDKLEAKYAQKNPKKNIISEPINNIKPIFKPLWTIIVWSPLYVASLITSRHHTYNEYNKDNNPIKRSKAPYSILCINEATPETNKNTLMDTAKGHGLLSNIWYKCLFFDVIFNKFYIY